ncbi:helix-turn-helix transcriptional regulator [Smaragdicoccus niigatensis]|uniref:helix-turn-helix transcriptional regulator n=1 Tax=Smaragdicoccus niigatensis TaxID=359359 RepID=UPI000685360C|nr:LuxR C-terminal-related transcriptional regulator [Smaragdicoccus niigatensis]
MAAEVGPSGPEGSGFPDPKLSPREREVLRVWLQSGSKSSAAKTLFMTTGTVSTHLTRVRLKYKRVSRNASSKEALLAQALRDGIVTLDEI